MWVGVEFYTILMKWCKNWCGLEMLQSKREKVQGQRKKVQSSTRFNKELKRLRWTIKEKGRPSVEAVGKGEGVLRAGFHEN